MGSFHFSRLFQPFTITFGIINPVFFSLKQILLETRMVELNVT